MCCVKIEEPPTERRILSLGLNRYALQNVMLIERAILETDNTAFLGFITRSMEYPRVESI